MRLFPQRVLQYFPTHHHSFVFFIFSCRLAFSRPFLPFFLMIVLIFILSHLSCFELPFPSCCSPFLVLLSLHRSKTSTSSILSSISLFSVQCMDTSVCLWIHLSHLLWRLVKTTLKVCWCQNLLASIICMIWEIITRSYLCRFNSRGVKPIPSIVMLLYSSTTFCHSII